MFKTVTMTPSFRLSSEKYLDLVLLSEKVDKKINEIVKEATEEYVERNKN